MRTADSQHVFEKILDNHGAAVERLLGHELVGLFGVSRSHEDDAERAVRAAMEIHSKSRELGAGIRIGISTGALYVSSDIDSTSDRMLAGPLIDRAIRLGHRAGKNRILTGKATYRHTRLAFEFTRHEPAPERKDSQAAVYEVTGSQQQTRKSRGIEGLRSELIGRDDALAALKTALDKTVSGEGQVVSLLAEAGIGKSRLVSELSNLASVAGGARPAVLWLEGRCQELGAAAGYWPFLEMLRTHFAWHRFEGAGERAASIVRSLENLEKKGSIDHDQLEEMGPLIGNLLSARFETAWDKKLAYTQPEEIRHRTFTALSEFFLGLSRIRPVVLILEDLHWADSLSHDLTGKLMEIAVEAPLFLLCVYRPDMGNRCMHIGTLASHKCADRYTEIRLRELTPDQSTRMVASLLAREDLSPAVRDHILTRSQGNPFCIEEVIRSLIDRRTIYREGGVWKGQKQPDISAPLVNVQGIIQGRMDCLTMELRRTLRKAAAIGHRFSLEILAQVASSRRLTKHMEFLEESGFIYLERAEPEREYAFKHGLVQDTIYHMIPAGQQHEHHGQIGNAIEVLYRSRLEEHREQWRVDSLEGLARACHGTGNAAEAEKHFRQAIDVARKNGLAPRRVASLYYWLGRTLMVLEKSTQELIRLGKEGLALLGDDRDSIEALLMRFLFVYGRADTQNWLALMELADLQVQQLEQLPYSEELATVITYAAWGCSLAKKPEHAAELLAFAENQARRHSDLRSQGFVDRMRARFLFFLRGDYARALSQIRKALALYAKTGDTLLQGECLLAMGKIKQAEQNFKRSLERADEYGYGDLAAENRARISYTVLQRKNREKALEIACETIVLLSDTAKAGLSDRLKLRTIMECHIVAGQACLLKGSREEALEHFSKSVYALASRRVRTPTVRWLSFIALNGVEEALNDRGKLEAFWGELKRAHTTLAGWPMPRRQFEP